MVAGAASKHRQAGPAGPLLLQCAPRPQCGGQGAVIEVIELAADWNALGEPRHLDPAASDAICEVVRGGLALDCRIQREDQLLARLQPADQALDVEVVRANAVERGQGSAEHVIATAKGPRAFERPQVSEVFDDTDRRLIPLRVATYRTRLDCIEIA